MKLNDFIAQMSKVFATVDVWRESEGLEEDMFVYFKDDDESIRFVFLAMIGPIYHGSIKKALELPFVEDIGIIPTMDNAGMAIDRAHDMIVILNEGIEDLDFSECVCECCECKEGCEESCDEEGCEPKKKMWN